GRCQRSLASMSTSNDFAYVVVRTERLVEIDELLQFAAERARVARQTVVPGQPPRSFVAAPDKAEISSTLRIELRQALVETLSVTAIEELRPLIAEGQERGILTVEQIATSLEEVEVTKEQIAELHAYLLDQGIEIVTADGKPVTNSEPEARSASRK